MQSLTMALRSISSNKMRAVLADMGGNLQSIDEWMRRRIRMVFWKKWRRVRTRWRNLLILFLNKNVSFLLRRHRL
ncbi:MAG: hypothetical protein ACI3V5_01530, partial [Faecousia sp.]